MESLIKKVTDITKKILPRTEGGNNHLTLFLSLRDLTDHAALISITVLFLKNIANLLFPGT